MRFSRRRYESGETYPTTPRSRHANRFVFAPRGEVEVSSLLPYHLPPIYRKYRPRWFNYGSFRRMCLSCSLADAPSGEKPKGIKTHLRNMLIVPEMIGSIVGIYNGVCVLCVFLSFAQ